MELSDDDVRKDGHDHEHEHPPERAHFPPHRLHGVAFCGILSNWACASGKSSLRQRGQ